MESQAVSKETEFNSSIATLMRIDQLIRELHSLRRGIIPRDKFGIPIRIGNTNELYLLTLFDLHIEIVPKMKANEFTDSEKLQKRLKDCQDKWGLNLKIMNITKGIPPKEYQNNNFFLGWEEIHSICDLYFMYLIKIADNHGMLLIDKKEHDEEPDDWG